MANVQIDYVVNTKSVDKATQDLKGLDKQTDKVTKNTEELTKKTDKQNKAFTSATDKVRALGNRFQIAGKGAGDMALGMVGLNTATTATTKGMKLLKIAIAATGIGALALAVVSLTQAFTKSEAGQNKWRKAMAALAVIVGNVTDILAIAGEQLINFFTGKDVNLDLLKEKIAGIVDETKNEIAISNELSDLQDSIDKRTRKQLEDRAKLETEMFQLRDKASRRDKFSAEERLAALDEAIKKNNEIFDVEVELARDRAFIANKKNELDKTDKEAADAAAAANAELYRAEGNRARGGLRLERERQTLIRETNTELQAQLKLNEELIESNKRAQRAFDEYQDSILDKGFKTSDQLEEKAESDADRNLNRLFSEKEVTDAIQQEKFDKESQNILDTLTLEEMVTDAKIKLAFGSTALISSLINEKSKAAKALALFDIGLAAAVGISSAVKSAKDVPFPANLVAIATTLGTVAGTISQAKGVLKKSGKPPKFGSGGLINGPLHSAGGVLLEGEGGEFIMSRNAVKSIGLDNLKAMNQGTIVNDLTPVAKAIENQPKHTLVWDEQGFTSYMRKGNDATVKRQARYKF